MIYIYALCCPESGRPRYVGKTKHLESRLRAHISKAKTHQTDHHCAHWIRSLLARGLRPTIMIVAQVPDGANWQAAEQAAIRAYKNAGYDLTNLTGGGEGFHDVPPDVIKRRVEARRRTLRDPERRAQFVKITVESRANDVVKKKQSDGVKSAWLDPNKRARLLAGMHTPEAVARRSAATRKRMHDPVIAAIHAANLKEAFKDPARREQLRQAREKRWRDYRESSAR